MRHRPLHHREISELVARQLGHVTRAQLLALQFSPSWVDHRVATGELIPVHAGVYAVGHVPRHALARSAAAVLACGPGAALSHGAAAALWGVADWPVRLEVSAPRDRRRPELITHRSRTLDPHELRTRHGVRTTSPVRTVLDLHPRLTDGRLARTVNDMRVAGHLGSTAFEELRRRSARVDRLLGDGRPTRSALEDLFRRFVTRYRLPMPEINAILPESGREVDALYRDARLIVELDSWMYHGDRSAFERDRAKDARALEDGYRTLRATQRRLTRGGAREAETIRRILGDA